MQWVINFDHDLNKPTERIHMPDGMEPPPKGTAFQMTDYCESDNQYTYFVKEKIFQIEKEKSEVKGYRWLIALDIEE